jgi:oligopeptide/dipeptide ABC transporter ATP-binding protein
MRPQTDALLEIKDLTVEFSLYEGVIRAVDSVSLKIMPQKTLGVIGESGSGKSVTAQAILGLVPCPPGKLVSGEIIFQRHAADGRTITTDMARLNPTGAEIRNIRGKDISMIFQEPMNSFGPLNTVGDQIMEAILIHEHGVSKKAARLRAIELLKAVGIPHAPTVVDSYPHQLSGGMRQRAMIAMAIALNPVLLLADEPTTALDVTVQAQILALLGRLKEEHGMAMLYITHNLAVVAEIADDVAVMYLGRVMEYCGVEEMTQNPLHPYTRGLQASIPRLDGDINLLQPIRGALPSPYSVPAGCPFSNRCTSVIAGVCDIAPPPQYREVSPGHWLCCHLYD